IRRYPDLYIHRIIKAYLHGKPQKSFFTANVGSIADHSSEMERNSAEAERETTDQKVAEYMADHIGESFDGIISGMSQGGLFVRLHNTAEGMIPFRTMSDYFVYDDQRLEARGKTSGQVYRIGQPVRIKVGAVDTLLRRIDFVFEDSDYVPGNTTDARPERRGNKKGEPRQRYSPKKGKGKKGKSKKGR
ncbi:MAG: S1 RNA-binding domain-containing protein, partial [Oscillospiraceae bacterium]|nr:S1 RNA-binding domain-containing protein [Oscillospiraceae bacterium]